MSGHHPGYKTAGGGRSALPVGVFAGVMALSCGLFICFLLWGGMELCYPQLLWQDGDSRLAVKCLEAQLVVTVSKDLFGTGKLIKPADLTLGPEGCKPLVSMDTDDVVRFEVGLHECGNSLQVRFGAPWQLWLWWEDTREAVCSGECGCKVGRGQLPFPCGVGVGWGGPAEA